MLSADIGDAGQHCDITFGPEQYLLKCVAVVQKPCLPNGLSGFYDAYNLVVYFTMTSLALAYPSAAMLTVEKHRWSKQLKSGGDAEISWQRRYRRHRASPALHCIRGRASNARRRPATLTAARRDQKAPCGYRFR